MGGPLSLEGEGMAVKKPMITSFLCWDGLRNKASPTLQKGAQKRIWAHLGLIKAVSIKWSYGSICGLETLQNCFPKAFGQILIWSNNICLAPNSWTSANFSNCFNHFGGSVLEPLQISSFSLLSQVFRVYANFNKGLEGLPYVPNLVFLFNIPFFVSFNISKCRVGIFEFPLASDLRNKIWNSV